MTRKNTAYFARGALLTAMLVAAGCQKKDSATTCTASVAGTDTSGAGANSNAGAFSGGAAGSGSPSTAGATAAGGTSSGGVTGLGQGGSGAAAATDGGGTGGASGAPPDSTTCSQLTLEACATNMACQGLSGQRISGDPQCLGQYEVVGCGTKVGCTPNATRATDLAAHDWVFPSTCIPAGWTNSTSSGTRFDACPSAAASSSPDAGTPDAG